MKETYPTSTTWPYVLSVLLLLALVLAPPTKWVSTIRDVRKDLATWFSSEGPPAHTLAVVDPVVVSFDPRTLEPRASTEWASLSTESESPVEIETSGEADSSGTPMLWEEIPLEATPPAVDATLEQSANEKDTTSRSHLDAFVVENAVTPESRNAWLKLDSFREHLQKQTRTQESVVEKAKDAEPVEAYVWSPPPGWKPTLIQPLAQESATEVAVAPARRQPATIQPVPKTTHFTDTMEQVSNEPVASITSAGAETQPIDSERIQEIEIQPPVANRVARLPRIDRDAIQRRLYQSKAKVTPVEIESQSAEILPTELATDGPTETQPTETQPVEPKIAEPLNDPAPTQELAESGQTKPAYDRNAIERKRLPKVADIWPQSPVLGKLLLEAKRDVVLTNWATSIEQTLNILQGNRVTGAADQRQALDRLRNLASMQVDRTRWPQQHRELHDRVRLALLRRVNVWQPLMQVAFTEPSSFATYRAQKQLQQTASKLKQTLAKTENAAPWIDYLALDILQNTHTDKLGYRMLADKVLLRMYSTQLDDQQRQFLQSPTFGQFETDLRIVIAKSVHPSELIEAIEAYEAAPSRSTANDLILLMQRWHSAPESKLYRPALAAISALYRNANLRVSVSEDLINRFVPAMRQYAERVNDTILGAAVTGSSSTHSNLAVKLIPDEKSIRLGLLAAGTVESNTASRKGPVTAFSRGQSAFAAGKEVRLTPQGMTTSATETRALSGNELIGIRTDWDDVPFLGSMLRSIAKDEIDEQQQQVEAEMEIRVRRNAQQRMDQELDSRVARAGKNLENNLVQPLRRLQLDPRAMEMRTTQNRAILRTRLAGPWQFGAHSPRPQIRSDSVMSFQIHQSAANNVIEQLELQNRRMTIEELMATLSYRFGIPLQVVDETHKDIVVKFGEHPLEFDFNNGQVQVTIHFAELKRQNRVWKDFSIRGIYRADVEQLDIALDREGSVSLIGDRIGLRDQLALRGIASKVFGKHRRLQILGDAIQQQPQLCNLTITQFTIRDGWLAVALGEKTGQTRMADRSVGMHRDAR